MLRQSGDSSEVVRTSETFETRRAGHNLCRLNSGPQRTEEDEHLLSVFKAVRKHNARVINIVDAFRQTGLNDKGQPKLGIARGNWKTVYFHQRRGITLSGPNAYTINRWNNGGGCFQDSPTFSQAAYAKTVTLPGGVFPDAALTRSSLKSAVPHVPANIRPEFHLRNYHILFEVENWETYPVDPFLLKRVVGNLFIVLAEWELTELEASLLGSMRGN
jgi:hypothetical protein